MPGNKDQATNYETSNRGNVVVVGAGLVGSMSALLLGRSGYSIKMFELRPGNG
jgi:monoamine oxidase